MAARKRTGDRTDDGDGAARTPGGDKAGQPDAAAADLARLLGTPLPVEERAYQLHLRGHSLREIGRELGIDKDTAHRYVRLLTAEAAPKRKHTRDQMRREAAERLRLVQRQAWTHYTDTGDLMALTIIRTCEQDITRLRGLLDAEVLGDGAGAGISITITRHAGAGDQGGDA